MATSITYKGSELASFSNNTKTLKTAGKYLEGDITVSASTVLGTTTVIPSETTQTINPASGEEGLSSVTVNGITNTYVGSGINRQTPSNVAISYNSSSDRLNINVPTGYYESTDSVVKRVDLILPTQSATTIVPSESSQTAVDIHKWTTGTVTVAAITPTYVGTGVTTNPTITVSGPSVTIPAGYYSSQQTKTVASGSVSTPSTTITANPTVSVNSSGLITASVTGSSNVAPSVSAGYISSGTAGTISVTGSTTLQLTTQGSTTVTPSTTTQTVNVTGKYMTGNVTVNPIPSQYIVPSGTYTISSVDSTNTFNVTNYASAKVTITDADSIAY